MQSRPYSLRFSYPAERSTNDLEEASSLGGTGGESVNCAGYSLIEKPIRAPDKHYPLF